MGEKESTKLEEKSRNKRERKEQSNLSMEEEEQAIRNIPWDRTESKSRGKKTK